MNYWASGVRDVHVNVDVQVYVLEYNIATYSNLIFILPLLISHSLCAIIINMFWTVAIYFRQIYFSELKQATSMYIHRGLIGPHKMRSSLCVAFHIFSPSHSHTHSLQVN